MVAKKERQFPADARAYTADDWLTYGGTASPTVREKLVFLTVDEVLRVGPADFSTKTVCDRLSVKYPMINYYFGGRDGLLAEATVLTQRRWVGDISTRLDAAPRDPAARLRAWIEGEISWSTKMEAMSVLINCPMASRASHEILETKHGDEMRRAAEFGLAVLTFLVLDVRSGTVTAQDFDVDSIPSLQILNHPQAFAAATSIKWSIRGLTGAAAADSQSVLSQHIDRLMEVAAGTPAMPTDDAS
jgi:AcrR family transcriptional regulator